jgi:hypothetical protein
MTLWVLEVVFTLPVVVGVNGNYMVHLDFLPLVLCVRIGGGCWWVMASCGFVQSNSMPLLKTSNFKFKYFYGTFLFAFNMVSNNKGGA